MTLPHSEGDLEIFRSRNLIVARDTRCNIRVGFDGRDQRAVALVEVPVELGPHMWGLCGNCDQVPDGYVTSTGQDVSQEPNKVELIVNSYIDNQSADLGMP